MKIAIVKLSALGDIVNSMFVLQFIKKYYDSNAKAYITKGKLKYIYPLTKELKDKCLKLKKPYPKNASKA